MAQNYSTQTITNQLDALGLPFAAVLARVLIALLTCRKASLHQVANLLPGDTDAEAKRQQIRRTLDQPALTQAMWATTTAALLPAKGPWVLALDRTEWRLGNTTINLLVLAVVCAGCAVPLLWLVLDKPGASDTAERIGLLERYLALFDKQTIRFVTADREFIGRDWLAWLRTEQVPFRIRIKAGKAGEWLVHADGRNKRAGEWFGLRACWCKPRPCCCGVCPCSWAASVCAGTRATRATSV